MMYRHRAIGPLAAVIALGACLSVPVARASDPPPPPLLTRLTPTPGVAVPTPSIVHTTIQRHTGLRLKTIHSLRHGDRARFSLAWRTNAATSFGVTGSVEILKGNKVIYRKALRGHGGALGGVLFADIRLTKTGAVGQLVARFTVHLGSTVHRDEPFTVVRA